MIRLQGPKFSFDSVDLHWWKATFWGVIKEVKILDQAFFITKLFILILSTNFVFCLNSGTNDIDTIRRKCSYKSY